MVSAPLNSCNESYVMSARTFVDTYTPVFSTPFDDVLTSDDCCRESKKALINLFSNVYPTMFDTVVSLPNGAVLLDYEDRTLMLNHIASEMFYRMKSACSYTSERTFGAELSQTLKAGVKKGSYSSIVVEHLANTFKTLNIQLTFLFGI